jgi:two-component sensor histidine kinase
MTSHRPVIEPAPGGQSQPELTQRALNQRIRQQEILAELGVAALKGTGFAELLDITVRAVAEGLGAELCKALEYLPGENRLIMRAGVGWDSGLIGSATIGADLSSPSGYALRTGKPVISNHLEREERFRTPELLAAHGVRRAINVILQGDGAPYGILEVDSRSEGEFTEHDITFLQGAANLLGMAIERQRQERSLQQALEHQQVLVKEINHRVKNSLQLVASMLALKGAGADSEVSQHLREAAARIAAIARAHDRLYRSTHVDRIELSEYLTQVCGDLTEATPNCAVSCTAPEHVWLGTDDAIRVALLVTELVTNAAKHAYPDGTQGRVVVGASRNAEAVRISVRDEGVGLPLTFDAERGRGLGMRLVQALAQQSKGTLAISRLAKGTEFVLELPLSSPRSDA